MSAVVLLLAVNSLFVLATFLALLLLFRRKGPDLAEPLARLEAAVRELDRAHAQTLATTLQTSTQNLVGAIGQVRQDVSDRVQQGLQTIQEKVDRQLGDGRREQAAQLETIRSKVDERLEGIGRQVQAKLDENLREGFRHFEKVQEHLKAAETRLQDVATVGASVQELSQLLRMPHLRGGFGEATLDRLLADFLPADAYEIQAAVAPGSAERVDALVRFPRTKLPIDSKFPREQVLPLFDTSDPARVKAAQEKLAQVIKIEAKRIAKYIRPDAGTADMALMFLPSETLYFEVIRNSELWESLAKLKVFPVSPNTLAVTLKGVALSYDYYEMARGVEHTIGEIRKAQSHFGHFRERFEEVGKELERAQSAFEKASTHLGKYAGSVGRLTGDAGDSSALPSVPLPPAPK
ncbi:MAG: DNA recombination protein RmuC [Nitrospirae bacterium]|nr:DNA recombination protein RmuC [Nitrospirota bacterium]